MTGIKASEDGLYRANLQGYVETMVALNEATWSYSQHPALIRKAAVLETAALETGATLEEFEADVMAALPDELRRYGIQ